MSEGDFYIGWKGNTSKEHRLFLKLFLGVVFLTMIIVVFIYVLSQNQFAESQYDVGNVTEYEGYLFLKPVPTLVRIDNEGKRESIMLVGYGKFGAERAIERWQEENSKDLEGLLVKLLGTLITYQGKKLLELTDEDEFVKWIDENQTRKRRIERGDSVLVSGEIVDPKCYFGAMKPGYGKIHRSCAIRCLSGGIPPVLVVNDTTSYILTLPEGVSVSALFGSVGKQIIIHGREITIDSQGYIRVSKESIKSLTNISPLLLDENLAFCKYDN